MRRNGAPQQQERIFPLFEDDATLEAVYYFNSGSLSDTPLRDMFERECKGEQVDKCSMLWYPVSFIQDDAQSMAVAALRYPNETAAEQENETTIKKVSSPRRDHVRTRSSSVVRLKKDGNNQTHVSSSKQQKV